MVADIVTQSVSEQRSIRCNAVAQDGRFSARLLAPGLVSYEDTNDGIALVRRDTLDKYAGSFIGNPLIFHTENGRAKHKSVYARGDCSEVGVIESVYYNAADGWYWADGPLTKTNAKDAMKRIGKVSCAYRCKESKRPGKHNGVKYNSEITEIQGLHLAIVDNPRYEEADIRLNSNKPNTMFKFWKKAPVAAAPAADDKTKENATEITGESLIDIGEGKQVSVADLVAKFNAAPASAPVEGEHAEVTGESEIEIEGAKVQLNSLIADAAELKTIKAEKAESDRLAAEKLNAAPAAPIVPKGQHFFKLVSAAQTAADKAAASTKQNGVGTAFETPQTLIARGLERYGDDRKAKPATDKA